MNSRAPAVTGSGGRVIKTGGRNLWVLSLTIRRVCAESALDIFRAFDAVNSVVPPDRDIFGSIGIGYGSILVIDEEDIFGSEVNIACKLGEDLAGKSEILLTQSAYAALPPDRYVCSPATFLISEMSIDCYRYERSLFLKNGASFEADATHQLSNGHRPARRRTGVTLNMRDSRTSHQETLDNSNTRSMSTRTKSTSRRGTWKVLYSQRISLVRTMFALSVSPDA